MNGEIDALLKMADKSIRGSRLLFEDGLYGFAVSRSYYAMFYLATAVLLTKDGTVEKSSDIRTFHPPRPSNSPRLDIIKVHDQRIHTRFATFPQQSTNKTRKLPAHQSKIDSHC
uniref:HEPN domain-containing protein n=1 Tax=Candidatus Methanogaster sp. ANME-2c ERB4 TaxID=2759911 RepID=A0A7G9Y8G3_9EURY|nr:hypothetical protein EMJGOPNH_00015 [Methanosarcinales archaeon ANME-2c ERB4]